jgi:hypothetical protein
MSQKAKYLKLESSWIPNGTTTLGIMTFSIGETYKNIQHNSTLYYAECRYAEGRDYLNVMLMVVMVNVIMLSVVTLNVNNWKVQ